MTITSKVELAFGADLTASPASWAYTDLSARALGEVSVAPGRSDEAGVTQPTRCTFRLGNTDGWLSPRLPSSPYYPNVRRQTPVRISLNPGTGYVQRFQGYIDEITPSWPSGNSEYAEVMVIASGSLRRLGQGGNPLLPAIQRAIVAASPAQSIPMADGAHSTQVASGLPGVAPIPISPVNPLGTPLSSPDFSGGSLAPWIGQGVSLANGGALVFPVPSTVGATAWTIDHVVNMGTDRGTNPGPWSLIYVDANRLFPRIEWSIDIQPANISGPAHDQLNLVFYVVTGPDTSTATTLTTQDHGMWDGLPHHLRLSTSQSGSNISWSLYADGQQFSGTVSSQTLQAPTGLEFNPQEQQTPTFLAGQAAVWSTATPSLSAADAYSATSGWAGELATARLARLCAEEGVPLTLSATASHLAMGPQRVDTLLNLLRECEAADGGILFDGLTAGLNYLSYPDRVNQAVALALDTKRRQVKLPFAPIEDDQRVRNDMTVTRPNGSFARVTDPVHIAANGLYDSSATRNVQFDSMLANQAGWAVRLGTVPEMRVPGVSLQLIDHPELWAAWLATTLGERITAANLPAQYPPGVLDMILEGYTETWDSASWRVDLNTSPYAPWIAATLNGLFRLEMVGQSLGAGLAPGATSLTLATSAGHQLFTTSAQYPADFPVDLNVGGWPVRVTATSSPLTDAFGRTVSNGWGNADTGQAWTIGSGSTADFSVGSGTGKQSHAAVNSLHAAQLNLGSSDVDYTVDVSVPIGSAVGASVTQWVIGRLSDLSNYYLATLSLTTTGTLTLQLSKRVAGTLSSVSSLVTVGTGHVSGEVWRVRLAVLGSSLMSKAWRPSVDIEPAWQVTGTDTSLTSGTQIGLFSRLETGNTNTLPVVISWDNLVVLNPQTLTISASPNTSTLPSGTAVSLWQPAALAL